jgi:hypothetical protein
MGTRACDESRVEFDYPAMATGTNDLSLRNRRQAKNAITC